jgi:hypothetical protein
MTRNKQSPLSFPEYQALEEAAAPDVRYEFIDGLVYAMSGGTITHNRIVGNIAFSLRDRFRNNGCQVLTENVFRPYGTAPSPTADSYSGNAPMTPSGAFSTPRRRVLPVRLQQSFAPPLTPIAFGGISFPTMPPPR